MMKEGRISVQQVISGCRGFMQLSHRILTDGATVVMLKLIHKILLHHIHRLKGMSPLWRTVNQNTAVGITNHADIIKRRNLEKEKFAHRLHAVQMITGQSASNADDLILLSISADRRFLISGLKQCIICIMQFIMQFRTDCNDVIRDQCTSYLHTHHLEELCLIHDNPSHTVLWLKITAKVIHAD
jgi:hypothetical protein